MAELKKKKYLELLHPLQQQLCEMQQWVQATGQRVVVVFEGRDTAGKGGAIAAITQVLNPRGCRIVALAEAEANANAVNGTSSATCRTPSGRRRDRAVRPQLVQPRRCRTCHGLLHRGRGAGLPDSKPRSSRRCWSTTACCCSSTGSLSTRCSRKKRFAERLTDPLKRWKISPIDIAARERYDDYTAARDAFFKKTHSKHAPWYVVDANDQKRARLNMIAHLLEQLPEQKVPTEALSLAPLKRKRLGRDVIGASAETVREQY
jgi:hypothetical protein